MCLEEQDAFLEKETGIVSEEISNLETQEEDIMSQLHTLEKDSWDERLEAEQRSSSSCAHRCPTIKRRYVSLKHSCVAQWIRFNT
jgi:hypothetical protein